MDEPKDRTITDSAIIVLIFLIVLTGVYFAYKFIQNSKEEPKVIQESITPPNVSYGPDIDFPDTTGMDCPKC